MPVEGERVVTSAEANAYPAGLPVGIVHYNSSHVPEVQPFARLDRLEIVRIFDYGLRGLLSPEAPARLPEKIAEKTPDKAPDKPVAGRR